MRANQRRSRMRQASHAIASKAQMLADLKRASVLTQSHEKKVAIEQTNAKQHELIRQKTDQFDRQKVLDGRETYYMSNTAAQV